MIICPDCGKEVPENKFCKNCGAYLVGVRPKEVESDKNLSEMSFDEKSSKNFKYCFNCGSQITGNFKFCPECGQNLKANVHANNSNRVSLSDEKNILVAVILSVFLPGLGQMYLGLDRKGAIFLISYVISAILILFIIGFLFVGVIWIWALIDTVISANALNRGEIVEDKLF